MTGEQFYKTPEKVWIEMYGRSHHLFTAASAVLEQQDNLVRCHIRVVDRDSPRRPFNEVRPQTLENYASEWTLVLLYTLRIVNRPDANCLLPDRVKYDLTPKAQKLARRVNVLLFHGAQVYATTHWHSPWGKVGFLGPVPQLEQYGNLW
jgi:hypothetical protein